MQAEESMHNTVVQLPGFWRRVGAFLMDGLILGVIGAVIGLVFYSFFLEIGPYGRLVGFAIALIYGSVFFSRMGKGQTPGKRLLKIRVVRKDGSYLSVGQALLRTFVLALPFLLNNWALPMFTASRFFLTLLGYLSSTLFLLLAYSLIFNRAGRQGLHDWICKSYVIFATSPVPALPSTPRKHYIIAVAIVILITTGTIIGSMYMSSVRFIGIRMDEVLSLYDRLNVNNDYWSVGVKDNVSIVIQNGEKTRQRIMIVNVWHKGRLMEVERIERSKAIAEIILNTYPDVEELDGISINMTTGIDLMIARFYSNRNVAGYIEEWEDVVQGDRPE